MQNVRGLLFNAALVFAFVIFSNLLRKEKTPPIKMKAVVSDGKKGIRVADIPTPELKEGQILIKVIAAAQNPTDWKHVEYLNPTNATVGCDFAGIVETLGSGVSSPAKGTRVAGFVQGATWEGIGAFAEYVATSHDLVWEIPEHTDFEQAAAIGGIAMETAAQAFYLRLGMNDPFNPTKKGEHVLVWAGSTSVGQYAIQLAHEAGYKVVTTASPKNFDLVKGLGAEAAYDYRDPETPKKIKEAYPDLALGFDCNSAGDSFKLAGTSMSSGKLVTLATAPEKSYDGVEPVFTLVYWTRGYGFKFFGNDMPAKPDDKKGLADWLAKVGKLVAEDRLKPNKIKVLGGLDKVQEGFDYMKSGKLSAEKLVYTI